MTTSACLPICGSAAVWIWCQWCKWELVFRRVPSPKCRAVPKSQRTVGYHCQFFFFVLSFCFRALVLHSLLRMRFCSSLKVIFANFFLKLKTGLQIWSRHWKLCSHVWNSESASETLDLCSGNIHVYQRSWAISARCQDHAWNLSQCLRLCIWWFWI